jgi:hypothetical protein
MAKDFQNKPAHEDAHSPDLNAKDLEHRRDDEHTNDDMRHGRRPTKDVIEQNTGESYTGRSDMDEKIEEYQRTGQDDPPTREYPAARADTVRGGGTVETPIAGQVQGKYPPRDPKATVDGGEAASDFHDGRPERVREEAPGLAHDANADPPPSSAPKDGPTTTGTPGGTLGAPTERELKKDQRRTSEKSDNRR